ncbi:MAG: MBL fold metallo-hydrolase [Candidatus Eisenbacteria bacterium]
MATKIRFLGAAQNVTGSKYLLECDGLNILVDCGIYQERQYKARNWEPFPVPPESIDIVLLTHAHLDHCGYLPRFASQGFSGRAYCTAASLEIARISLMDSAHVLAEDAEFKIKRHEREGRKGPHPVVPLYTEEDVRNCLPLLTPWSYEKPLELGDGIVATFHDAGHILGASMIKLSVPDHGDRNTVLFSGDIGRRDKPILNDPTVFKQADYVVMESTYGDRLHEDPADVDSLLEDAIVSTAKRGGNVVIPSFAIGRTQELLYRLNTLLLEDRIPHVSVFIDSPMAIRVTEVFKHHRNLFDNEMIKLVDKGHSPFTFPGLKMTSSVEESKAINYVKKGAVIIAGSGMCTGGRVKHHLVSNIPRPESMILFVGYQAGGTLGREIVEGAKQVRIYGQMYPVRAKIAQINGFSAHADSDELLTWITGLEQAPKHVFITHGEPEAAQAFAGTLRKKTKWKVSIPAYGDEATLE